MNRKMRRWKQLLPQEVTEELMNRNSSGVLSLMGDEGYPYGVPVNYAFDGDKIYFHSGKQGYKMECILANSKCSFTVIDMDENHPEDYTSYFRSAIATGDVSLVENPEESTYAIRLFTRKYVVNVTEEERIERIKSESHGLQMLRMDIKELSGKEAIELVRMKESK